MGPETDTSSLLISQNNLKSKQALNSSIDFEIASSSSCTSSSNSKLSSPIEPNLEFNSKLSSFSSSFDDEAEIEPQEPIREQLEKNETDAQKESMSKNLLKNEIITKNELIKSDLRSDKIIHIEPMTEQVVKNEPIREELENYKLIRDHPNKNEPIRDKIDINEPIREESVLNEPIRENVVQNEPIREESCKNEPIGELECVKSEKFGKKSAILSTLSAFVFKSSDDRSLILNNSKIVPNVPMCKSSSESNIPLCHNSLESLADSLPSILPMSDDSRRNSLVLSFSSERCGNSSNVGKLPRVDPSCEKSEIFSSRTKCGGCEPCGYLAPKFKLVTEGDIQVCKVKHGSNFLGKLKGARILRRWETHHLYLNDMCISSKTPMGWLTRPISYWQMEEVYVVVRWDGGRRYIIRILLPDGSLLLQPANVYSRDQWYHSIIWKKNIFKYQNLMRSSKRPEVILKELKSLVDFATNTPLQDDCISHVPIEIVSNLLDSGGELLGKSAAEEVLVALAPLLEKSHPPPSLCRFLSRHCQTRPRCPLITQLFTPVVRRALKHNVVRLCQMSTNEEIHQDYILALSCHNDGINQVRNFVRSMHGPVSSCPHPKVLSNLVSVSLSATFTVFERQNHKKINRSSNISSNFSENINQIPWDEQLLSFLAVFDTISEFEDWRPNLAQFLQPIPFPDEALSNPLFIKSLSSVMKRIGSDSRCEVHTCILGSREEKEGWFHLLSPSNPTPPTHLNDFDLWAQMLETLLNCCCKRKKFLSSLSGKLLGSTLLLALREHGGAQEALCLLLEWDLVGSVDIRVQIATTLQSTPSGEQYYEALCSKQLHLQELQQKGGPRKLTLPSRSTDADLKKLLSCGSLGNLECLSLAFTQISNACAEELIKLPSLKYLNLWSTQFGDLGLQLISEHLTNLHVLNLCETPVTDKGILSLISLTNLRKLNLNSTGLTASTYGILKEKLPELKEIDIRYTDAW